MDGTLCIRFRDKVFEKFMLDYYDTNGDGGVDYTEASTNKCPSNDIANINYPNVKIAEYGEIRTWSNAPFIVEGVEKIYTGHFAYYYSFGKCSDISTLEYVETGDPMNLEGIVCTNCINLQEANLKYASIIPTHCFKGCHAPIISIPNIFVVNDYCFEATTYQTFEFHEGVEHLGNGCFYNCSNLNSIILPSTVKRIGGRFVELCTAMESFYIKAITPPILGSTDAFRNNSCTIYVPVGCGSVYKTATNWGAYADRILEAELCGVYTNETVADKNTWDLYAVIHPYVGNVSTSRRIPDSFLACNRCAVFPCEPNTNYNISLFYHTVFAVSSIANFEKPDGHNDIPKIKSWADQGTHAKYYKGYKSSTVFNTGDEANYIIIWYYTDWNISPIDPMELKKTIRVEKIS